MYAIVRRYNLEGAAAIGDHRHANPGKAPLLSPPQQAELEQAVDGPAPDGGLWTGPKVARWMSAKLGRMIYPVRGWELLHSLGGVIARSCGSHPMCGWLLIAGMAHYAVHA
jgi:hypothetical protein